MARDKVPVTMRALIQRINRKLREDDQMLRKARGARSQQVLGDYFILNLLYKGADAKDVEPETLARKLGVLADYERLVED